MKAPAITLIAALALSGCAHDPVYVVPRLDLPPPPVLPVVFASEFIDLAGDESAEDLREALPGSAMVCVSVAGYEALAVRERLRKGYAEQLRAIIEEHNRRAEGAGGHSQTPHRTGVSVFGR